MVVFSPFVLLLCTLWELFARFLIDILLFTDQKKKKMSTMPLSPNSNGKGKDWIGLWEVPGSSHNMDKKKRKNLS